MLDITEMLKLIQDSKSFKLYYDTPTKGRVILDSGVYNATAVQLGYLSLVLGIRYRFWRFDRFGYHVEHAKALYALNINSEIADMYLILRAINPKKNKNYYLGYKSNRFCYEYEQILDLCPVATKDWPRGGECISI